MVEKFPTAVVKNLKTKAVDLLSSVVTGGGNNSPLNGVTQWTSVVQKALSFLGQPQGYLGLTLRRMNQESGGNPRAVNLWDSNAKAGHPSVGLLQLIEGTWRRYAGDMINQGPFMYGVSVDPFANVYASMRYALSRYGSLPAAYDRAGGYDEGGWMQPGDWLTYNHTGKPEPVFTADQWSTLKANIGARQGSPNLAADVRVFVGDRELTDIVRTEVTTYDAATARGIDIGRRF
jgi:SLT domain-containing protein